MDKKFGYYIFGGTLIGALFGMFWIRTGNPILSIAIGALIGTAIGWFAAAYAMEEEKKGEQLNPVHLTSLRLPRRWGSLFISRAMM